MYVETVFQSLKVGCYYFRSIFAVCYLHFPETVAQRVILPPDESIHPNFPASIHADPSLLNQTLVR